jgi:hypothetical protein
MAGQNQHIRHKKRLGIVLFGLDNGPSSGRVQRDGFGAGDDVHGFSLKNTVKNVTKNDYR